MGNKIGAGLSEERNWKKKKKTVREGIFSAIGSLE